jgi:cathepsin A (carboxypeptidase C)
MVNFLFVRLVFQILTVFFIVSDRAKDGDLCYRQMNWIATWMNNAANKKELGVPANLRFDSCNMEVNQAFFKQGDGMHNSAALLPEIIDDDIKLLVYAGNADAMCNYMVRYCSN